MSRYTHVGPRSGPRGHASRHMQSAALPPPTEPRHTRTHAHTLSRAHWECVSGCSICMWLFWPSSLGQDLRGPLESRVMVQESTSGRVCVYAHVSWSPRWKRKQVISILLLECKWRWGTCASLVGWGSFAPTFIYLRSSKWEWTDLHLSKCNKLLFSSNFMLLLSFSYSHGPTCIHVVLLRIDCGWVSGFPKVALESFILLFFFFNQPLKCKKSFCSLLLLIFSYILCSKSLEWHMQRPLWNP